MHDDQLVLVGGVLVQDQVTDVSVVDLIDDISAEELCWQDFVDSRQEDIIHMNIVTDEESHQMPELVFVDVVASPDQVLGDTIPVGHGVEEVEECLCGNNVALTEECEWSVAFLEPSIAEHCHEVEGSVQVLEVVLVVNLELVVVFLPIAVIVVHLQFAQEVNDEDLTIGITKCQFTVVLVIDVEMTGECHCNAERNYQSSLHLVSTTDEFGLSYC